MKLKLSTLFVAAMLLLMTSCNKENEINNQTLVPIHVNTNGFNVTQEDFESTRAATTADDYTNINAIILAFYQGNTEIKRLSQLRDAMAEGENFGEFNLYLPIGKYTMLVVAYSTNENSPFTLTSLTEAAFTGLRVKDTFVATQTVDVTSGNPLALSATLNRIVSQLTVTSTDGKAPNADKLRMTLSGGSKAFNPSTGLATDNLGFDNAVTITKDAGQVTSSATMLFLSEDTQNIDVTIDVLDAQSNFITHRDIANVPFKRNKVTLLTGPLYSSSTSVSPIQLNADWLPTVTITF